LPGTHLDYQGHIILGKSGSPVFLNKNGGSRIVNSTPAPRNKTVNVSERKLTKRETLGDAVSSPRGALDVINNVESDDAMVLFNAQNEPVGILPLDLEELQTIRSTPAQSRLYKAVESSNAAAAIIKHSNEKESKDGAKNVSGLMDSLEVNVLDVYYKSEEGVYKSAAEDRDLDSYKPSSWFSLNSSGYAIASDNLAISEQYIKAVVGRITRDWVSGERYVVFVKSFDS